MLLDHKAKGRVANIRAGFDMAKRKFLAEEVAQMLPQSKRSIDFNFKFFLL